MTSPVSRSFSPEQLLWGIRDRNHGRQIAQDLSQQVLDRFDSSPDPALLRTASQVQSQGQAQNLSPSQLQTALFIAGSMQGIPASLAAQEALKAVQVPANQWVGQLAQGVEGQLTQAGCSDSKKSAALLLAGALRRQEVELSMQQWASDPKNPQAGLACGSLVKPEAFFNLPSQKVISTARNLANPSGLEEVKAGRLTVVNLNQLFQGKNEVVIGFGKPNVFTLIPPPDHTPQGPYKKLDAYMFYRKKTGVVNANVVQSGVFLRPRNLPPEAVGQLRQAMQAEEGQRDISCARSNARMLSKAGFTSGGKSLAGQFRPQQLFRHILAKGLEYQGQPLEFDIINTTPQTVEEHFRAVIKKEQSSPVRAVEKSCQGESKSPEELEGLRQAKKLKAIERPEVALAAGPPVQLRQSRPSDLAIGLREIWGQHILWEALPNSERVDIDQYLPEVLKDKFSLAKEKGEKLSVFDKVKNSLFSKPMVAGMRRALAKNFDPLGEYQPAQLRAMLPASPPGQEPIKFNVVICGPGRECRTTITRLDVDKKLPDWVLSKHVLISGYDPDVRFAGEIWAERYAGSDGQEHTRINLNNNSGTYRPKAEQVPQAAAYLSEMFPGVEFVGHPLAPPQPKVQDHQKTFEVKPEQFPSLAQELSGQRLTLHDDSGKAQKFVVRPFQQVRLDSQYYDTPDRALASQGGMLRARTNLGPNGKVKDIELEAKRILPQGTQRVKGVNLENRDDPAVALAREIIGSEAPLQPVAWKNNQRQLYLVSPDRPFGRFQPSFVLSLDTAQVRDQADPRGAHQSAPWHVLEPQIFTKLPWSKNVTQPRLAQFDDLCLQLAQKHSLPLSDQSGYVDALKHLHR